MPMADDVLRALDGEPVAQCFPIRMMFEILETIRSRITVEGSSVAVTMGSDVATIEKYSYGSVNGPDLRLMKTVGMVQDMMINLTISNTRSGFPAKIWMLGITDTCYNKRELLSFLSRYLRTPAVSMQLMIGLVEGDGVAVIQQPRTMNDAVEAEMRQMIISPHADIPAISISGPTQLNW